jgi:hypothetical protein
MVFLPCGLWLSDHFRWDFCEFGGIGKQSETCASEVMKKCVRLCRLLRGEFTLHRIGCLAPMLWSLFERCSPIFGDVRQFSAMFANFWRCSPIFGATLANLRRCSPIFGDVRQFAAMFANFQRCSPIFGDVRQFWAKRMGFFFKTIVMYDNFLSLYKKRWNLSPTRYLFLQFFLNHKHWPQITSQSCGIVNNHIPKSD